MSSGYQDPELELLSDGPALGGGNPTSASSHALRTSPIFTGDAFNELTHDIFPQRALYGRIISQHTISSSQPDELVSPKLYINTNSPFSALVCGVQGSGKSHSTSVLLESCLVNDRRIGTLPAPLSALVFHFDTAAGGGAVQPCEAAYLSSFDPMRGTDTTPPPVIVLVVPTYLSAMRRVYASLPNVRVEPLLFAPEEISGERLLAMMKVDDNGQMPLYMEAIMSILRGMEDNFNYREFREQVGRARFSGTQKAMLNLRLALLDSCLNGGDSSNSLTNHFQGGQLTIIDLSSPFMDGASACGFFDIILGLFVEADIRTSGKIVVLDEAHKYLSESQSGTSGRLTSSLLTVIRQQRHLGTRVIVSTQEPTVVPSRFLDLCSIIIAHRFSSPKWLKTLAEHVSAANSSQSDMFDKIVSLETGQAVLFSPNGLCARRCAATAPAASRYAETEAVQQHSTSNSVGILGQGYLVVRSRLRLTLDGGCSLLAVASTSSPNIPTILEPSTNSNYESTHVDAATSFETTDAPPAGAEGHSPIGLTSQSPPIPAPHSPAVLPSPVPSRQPSPDVVHHVHWDETISDESPRGVTIPSTDNARPSPLQVFLSRAPRHRRRPVPTSSSSSRSSSLSSTSTVRAPDPTDDGNSQFVDSATASLHDPFVPLPIRAPSPDAAPQVNWLENISDESMWGVPPSSSDEWAVPPSSSANTNATPTRRAPSRSSRPRRRPVPVVSRPADDFRTANLTSPLVGYLQFAVSRKRYMD